MNTVSQFRIATTLVAIGKSSKNNYKEKASWIVTIYVLAMATHIGFRHDVTISQEREIARHLHEKDLGVASEEE